MSSPALPLMLIWVPAVVAWILTVSSPEPSSNSRFSTFCWLIGAPMPRPEMELPLMVTLPPAVSPASDRTTVSLPSRPPSIFSSPWMPSTVPWLAGASEEMLKVSSPALPLMLVTVPMTVPCTLTVSSPLPSPRLRFSICW